MDEQTLYNYLVAQGISPDTAASIATQIWQVSNGFQNWQPDQIDNFVNDVVTQAQNIKPSFGNKLSTDVQNVAQLMTQSGLGYKGYSPLKPYSTGTKEISVNMPATINPDLVYWMVRQGVQRDRANQLATQLGQLDTTLWSDQDYQNYVNDWVKTALSDQYDTAIREYKNLYNPQTGLSWKDESAMMQNTGGLFNFQNSTNPQQSYQQKVTADNTQMANEVQAQKAAKAEQEWYNLIGKPKNPNDIAEPFLSGLNKLSPNLQKYFQGNIGNIYNAAGMSQLRAQFQKQRSKYNQAPSFPGENIGGGNVADRTPEQQAEADQLYNEWHDTVQAQRAMKDPWQSFLEQYPFLEKFNALTPQEKGYNNSRYRMPTSWR